MRRPSKPTEAALDQFAQWMEQTRRTMDAMRAELDALKLERTELLAQLRFATEQANRETLAAARLAAELKGRRSADSVEINLDDEEDDGPVITVARRAVRHGANRASPGSSVVQRKTQMFGAAVRSSRQEGPRSPSTAVLPTL